MLQMDNVDGKIVAI